MKMSCALPTSWRITQPAQLRTTPSEKWSFAPSVLLDRPLEDGIFLPLSLILPMLLTYRVFLTCRLHSSQNPDP